MKYSLFFLLLVLFSLVSCGGDDSSDKTEEPDSTTQDTLESDTLGIDTMVFDGLVYTAHAAIDGPDEELWVFEPGEWDGEVTTPFDPSAEMLHVIPYDGLGAGIHEEMSSMNKGDFKLYGDFKAYSGPVVVFYDRTKEHIAAQFVVKEGEPNGDATIYQPTGEIYWKSYYKNGVEMEVLVSPYAHDWSFSQSDSKLQINDVEGHKTVRSNGETQWSISYSINSNQGSDNYMSKVMEKGSFENPFQINDEVFTGTLLAYMMPTGVMHENEYYELNFKEGWLHGDVKIYSEWFGLELHEVFEMGELDTTIFVLNTEDMDGLAKPIIYLYPEKDMKVNVQLDVDGEITHTYPAYNKGWNVLAKPDGTLFDEKGKEYYALYWEGNNRTQFDVKSGFIVPGNETAAFLEESLEILGLNRREANEFIVFWLPVLENNPYNLIHFSADEYEQKAKLKVTPSPETMIRVMMVYKPLQSPIEIPLQDLNKMKVERKGFTVVEWGGSLLKANLAL